MRGLPERCSHTTANNRSLVEALLKLEADFNVAKQCVGAYLLLKHASPLSLLEVGQQKLPDSSSSHEVLQRR